MWWDPRTVVQEITAIEDSLYYTSKCPKEEHKCRWRNMYIKSHWNPGNQENDGRGILHWTVNAKTTAAKQAKENILAQQRWK